MNRRLSPSVLTLLVVTLATACSDSPTGVAGSTRHISFTYSGAYSSSFQASSAPSASPGNLGSYAMALIPPNDTHGQEYLSIIAMNVRSTTSADAIMLMLTDYAVGTYRITEECVPMHLGCSGGFIALDVVPDGNWTQHDTYFAIGSGTITIATSARTRITGTFSGTAYAVDPETGSRDPGRTLTITNGTFDLPLMDSKRYDY